MKLNEVVCIANGIIVSRNMTSSSFQGGKKIKRKTKNFILCTKKKQKLFLLASYIVKGFEKKPNVGCEQWREKEQKICDQTKYSFPFCEYKHEHKHNISFQFITKINQIESTISVWKVKVHIIKCAVHTVLSLLNDDTM